MRTNNFKIGEKVAVLDETIIGEITLITNSTITIKDENEFLYNYQYNELVKIFDFEESFVDEHKLFLKKKNNHIKKVKVPAASNTILEVDLHIDQITKSNKNLSNFDMLSRQLNYAKQQLNFAIKNNIQKIVFIHGVGQGVLKADLYQLFKKYNVEINDANYQKYGRGATEVYIFKNN